MNLHGGSARVDELEALDGEETARLLIGNGSGTITPYGVVYDNGMQMKLLYDGQFFPCYSIEWDKDFDHIDWYADIMTVTAQDILERFGRPDVIWASPDCATFSIAAISHHRRKDPVTGNLDPISEYAKFCDAVDQHVLRLILAISPMYWFIENPRGGMRKMTWMQGLPRYTVTYCQYGDNRMKPTDIWTNHPDPGFKPPCHNGDPCHVAAPRGAKTGTQGLAGSRERSVIPAALCEHIVDICEGGMIDVHWRTI